uniref:Uncharacterized protein n=1 Tax=Chromera velia CCMP2878 TaxID=1169474 RepID=A0A0G4I4T2_9ALVE|eukprot:Cvel_10959.t1-p1 / transcript=Cvel_10959.t1 / gene=Cvel_10959 / organism=Chromera_velia_CCMP2878 / gene_product=hypothetical protein / transcript_product=hypothetical protein / location=Cvel_scaffold674:13777-14771(+) / protein_length=177 / sequence_SO=supercontig / SO=protein_coding / is_pseudo=false
MNRTASDRLVTESFLAQALKQSQEDLLKKLFTREEAEGLDRKIEGLVRGLEDLRIEMHRCYTSRPRRGSELETTPLSTGYKNGFGETRSSAPPLSIPRAGLFLQRGEPGYADEDWGAGRGPEDPVDLPKGWARVGLQTLGGGAGPGIPGEGVGIGSQDGEKGGREAEAEPPLLNPRQ